MRISKIIKKKICILSDIFKLLLKLFGINLKQKEDVKNSEELEQMQKLLNLVDDYKIVKLHLGCGAKYMDGWINIDAVADEFTFSPDCKVDVKLDLSKPLGLKDESVDFYFHDNFFEHLTYEDGLNLLKEHYRTLKKGGVVRIIQPDLQELVEIYKRDGFNDLMINGKTYQEHYANYTCLRNRAESLNYSMRQFGQHKYLYDYEAMKQRLIDAGFSENKIKRFKSGISDIKELAGLEGKNMPLSLVVEATK